ncbi:MAG: response regulator transcription factor [Bacteroidales bacterium]
MSTPKKILLIDDEPDVLEFLSYNLKNAGYQVFTAKNGALGLEKAVKIKADLIILDLMMPDIDGVEVCERIRNNPQINNSLILFLTARSEDYSQVAGFDAGADDYIAKPVNPKVLIRRVKALLKRKLLKQEKVEISNTIETKSVIIDQEKYQVRYSGQSLMLPRKEYELLCLLTSIPEKVFTREEIYNKIWGDTFVGERTIDVHINKLRKKLGTKHIITVKGVGYKYVD